MYKLDVTRKRRKGVEWSAYLVVKWIVAGFLDGRVAELLANLNLDDGVNVKARELHALNYRDGHL